MRRQLHSRKGFTLAELLVVVAIVGILVSVSIPVFTIQAEKSRETTDVANLRSAYSAARYLSALGEFTVTDADGKNPKTYIWEADYPHLKGSSSGNANPFFYDPDSGQIYYTCPKKPCGKGTSVDGGTKSIFFGKGEYRGDRDFRKANIVIYFENSSDEGAISVYFGYKNGDAVVQH